MLSLLRSGVAACATLGTLGLALVAAGPAFAYEGGRPGPHRASGGLPPAARHLLQQALPLTPRPALDPAPSPSPARKYAEPSAPVDPVQPATTALPAAQVIARINAQRLAHGLRAYRPLAGLAASGRAHDLTMAAGCGLSHRCAREAVFSARISAQGVRWQSAGENVGTGKPVANTTAAIAAMALRLTDTMFAEVPPNDGHRQNLLDTDFRYIGVDVYRDPHGAVWMTQDLTG